jgi:hypothetical protein
VRTRSRAPAPRARFNPACMRAAPYRSTLYVQWKWLAEWRMRARGGAAAAGPAHRETAQKLKTKLPRRLLGYECTVMDPCALASAAGARAGTQLIPYRSAQQTSGFAVQRR